VVGLAGPFVTTPGVPPPGVPPVAGPVPGGLAAGLPPFVSATVDVPSVLIGSVGLALARPAPSDAVSVPQARGRIARQAVVIEARFAFIDRENRVLASIRSSIPTWHRIPGRFPWGSEVHGAKRDATFAICTGSLSGSASIAAGRPGTRAALGSVSTKRFRKPHSKPNDGDGCLATAHSRIAETTKRGDGQFHWQSVAETRQLLHQKT
jgi:hypothetical protein